MVTITVSEYFEEGSADEYATLRVESDAIGPDSRDFPELPQILADIQSGAQWITVVPADDGTLSVRIAASAVRSPGVQKELEHLITSLTEREDALRRSGEAVHENNRVLDHLVISLTGNGEDGGDDGDKGEPKKLRKQKEHREQGNRTMKRDDASVVSQLMNSETKIPSGHKWYDTALARNPKDAMAWNAKGEAHQAAGQTSEARKCFIHAVEIEPAYADARYNLNHVERIERID